MVPKETDEATDSLPKAQSKSRVSELDGSVIVASTNVPEILTASDCGERLPESSRGRVCDTMMPPPALYSQAASSELPLNVVEGLVRVENSRTSHDADGILNQGFPEEAAFCLPDPAGCARSDQGVQITGSPPISSVLSQNITTAADQWTLRSASLVNQSEDVHEAGVQPPNISYSGSTVNASADASLPNNPMGQSPRLHFPSYIDICDYELEKLNKEQGTLKKNFEETTLELKAELERKMAEVRSEYDRKSQEVDTEYNAIAKQIGAFRSLVAMNSLLANAYRSSRPVKSATTDTAAVRAGSSQHPTQQQQAVQTNMNMNSAAPPRPSVTTAEAPIPSGPPSHFPRCNTPQPRPISQQAVQTNTNMNSTAPPQPSVTTAEAPRPSGPLSHFPPQPRPISQQAAAQSNPHMNSTALPRPSITAEALPLHSAACNTPQPRPISQLPVIQSNRPISSTAPPRPSVTSEAIPLHSPPCNTPQPRPISQLPVVQSNTHISSIAPPGPSVISEAISLPSPPCNMPQPRPISPLPVVQANTPISSTAPHGPSVTSKAISLHSPPCNTSQPRPPPLISSHTPTSYSAASTPHVHGIVRRTMAPHLRSSRPPNSVAASTTNPTRQVQQQQQQQGNSNSSLVYLSDDD
ncbi:PREDICTED: flocculation protein FLO11-like isoform X2 [Camelina sativa]|uniref:Flocculation protein FLO11-like isoform X2 n=1 Tax=Camelina sativa TaxID=90675 RepID=A0ABM0WEZ1_CAMSA|nr:PREDICTED: flocculation protein FLO11-like isoform X2 [Camelina sativa]